MPHDPDAVGSAADWLERARSNLARAKQPRTPEILWQDLCFDCQQAAEKAVKAVLTAKGIAFRYVHDLAELLTALTEAGYTVPSELNRAAALTDYAVVTRYPGPSEPVTEIDFREALGIAEHVVQWAEAEIEATSKSDLR